MSVVCADFLLHSSLRMEKITRKRKFYLIISAHRADLMVPRRLNHVVDELIAQCLSESAL